MVEMCFENTQRYPNAVDKLYKISRISNVLSTHISSRCFSLSYQQVVNLLEKRFMKKILKMQRLELARYSPLPLIFLCKIEIQIGIDVIFFSYTIIMLRY